MTQIKVTLVRSPIGRSLSQKRTVEGLGLRKLNHSRVHNATLPVLGMVRKVAHLVHIEEITEDASGSKEAIG
jgi:large subunit ribosomal protein L30